MGNLWDIAAQGVAGAVSEIPGKLLSVGHNAALSIGQNPVKYAVGSYESLSPGQHEAAKDATKMAGEFGMELLPHQAYDDPRMTSIWKYLKNHPKTSSAVRSIEDHIADKNSRGFNDFINENRSPLRDNYQVNQKLIDASNAAEQKAIESRSNAVGPLFDGVKQTSGPVNVTNIIDNIDNLINSSKGDSLKTLKQVKGMLQKNPNPVNMEDFFKDFGEKHGLTQQYMDDYLQKFGPYGPEDRVGALHEAKMQIDHLLEGPNSASIDATTQYKLMGIKGQLIDEMDNASSGKYKEALKKYSDMSGDVNNIKTSVVGRIGKLEGDKVSRAMDMMFGENPDAHAIMNAKKIIQSQDPQAWKDAYHTFLKKEFDKFYDSTVTSDLKSPGAKLYDKYAKGENRKEILRAVTDTPEQYKTLTGFFDILKKTGIGTGKESGTQMFKNVEEELTNSGIANLADKAWKLKTSPFSTTRDFAMNKWNDILLHGNQDKLLDALTSKDAVRNIAQIKKLSPDNIKFWKKLSTVLSMGGESIVRDKIHRSGWQDILPESVNQFMGNNNN